MKKNKRFRKDGIYFPIFSSFQFCRFIFQTEYEGAKLEKLTPVFPNSTQGSTGMFRYQDPKFNFLFDFMQFTRQNCLKNVLYYVLNIFKNQKK